MEADLNANLQTTVRKGQPLSGLNDWRSTASITREKSVFSLEDQVFLD